MCYANETCALCGPWYPYETGSCSYTVTTVGGSRLFKLMDTLKKKKEKKDTSCSLRLPGKSLEVLKTDGGTPVKHTILKTRKTKDCRSLLNTKQVSKNI